MFKLCLQVKIGVRQRPGTLSAPPCSEGDVFMLGTDCSFKIQNQVIPLKLIVFVSLQQAYFYVWQKAFSFILFSIHVIIGVFCKNGQKATNVCGIGQS